MIKRTINCFTLLKKKEKRKKKKEKKKKNMLVIHDQIFSFLEILNLDAFFPFNFMLVLSWLICVINCMKFARS
jgi:hypothetical protein